MKLCKLCSKPLAPDKPYDRHPVCIKRMFGVRYVPTLAVTIGDIPTELPHSGQDAPLTWFQQKVPLQLNRKSKKIVPAAPNDNAHFLMKPQVRGLPNLPQNEHTCLTIAAHMGTAVPPHTLMTMPKSPAGMNPVLLSRNFGVRMGKRGQPDTPVKRLDFMKLLGKSDPYQGDLVEIGQSLWDISQFPGLDVQLFFEMVFLAFILGCRDLHFKRFAIIHDEEDYVRLAPAYDMISTELALPGKKEDDFAMPMAGKTSDIRGHDILHFSRMLRIPEKAYERIFFRIFKGKRVIGRLIKNSVLGMDEKLAFSDVINNRFKRLLG